MEKKDQNKINELDNIKKKDLHKKSNLESKTEESYVVNEIKDNQADVNFLQNQSGNTQGSNNAQQSNNDEKNQSKEIELSSVLCEKISQIQDEFNNVDDLIIKNINILGRQCAAVYLLGLTDTVSLSQFVIESCNKIQTPLQSNVIEYLMNNVLACTEMKKESSWIEIEKSLLSGKSIFFVDGEDDYIILSVDKYKERALAEPPTSAVLKGPRSGFNENLKTNLACVRKILATKDLVTQYVSVGKYTHTKVAVLYINSIADKNIANDVVEKIKEINIDGIIDSFYIISFLEKRKNSMFKQVGYTEKPDVLSAKMLEGRVGILVDGSPIALTVPFLFIEDFQSGDDYYSQHAHSSFVRILRIFSFLITALLPGMYVAIEIHHYKTIPLKFLVTIINTTQDLPLTPFVEMIFVLILFEILYEASLRMPKYLGLALSVVGALILGDTAVKAGLISPPTVMIVAVSGITLYTVPDLAPQMSIIRLAFTFAGGLLGFYGMVLFSMFLFFYLNNFDSYGSAYLSPIAPYKQGDFKDAFIKTDITQMKTRPESIKNKNKIRLNNEERTND